MGLPVRCVAGGRDGPGNRLGTQQSPAHSAAAPCRIPAPLATYLAPSSVVQSQSLVSLGNNMDQPGEMKTEAVSPPRLRSDASAASRNCYASSLRGLRLLIIDPA